MTLAIVVKGTEGVALAVDSRVTLTLMLTVQPGTPQTILPATYDNATKLLHVAKQKFVGAITYGNAIFDPKQPRTASSFLPEFEASLPDERISVWDFATKLGKFYLDRWNVGQQAQGAEPASFMVSGYDEGEAYGRLYTVVVPTQINPQEILVNDFGANWGGQIATVNGLLNGAAIPWQLLPLQDCVDVAILAVKTTAEIQKFVTDIRGVGGPIDVAVITKTDGFRYLQSKSLRGEHDSRRV